ncbi:MAG: NUDIX hydrolase [Chloroflexota bacterium]
MPIKPWKILESHRPRKYLRLDRCELPNGNIIEQMILEFGTWATIVALTRNQEVVLIKQYRHGVGKVIWEFPGGVIDPGETPMEAAKRELLEESGFGVVPVSVEEDAAKWIDMGPVSPNPDNHTNLIHTFLALDVEKISHQDLDENEEIDVFLIPLDEVIRMAKDGELLQAMQVSALFFALLHLKRIQ